jgi:hypothetical protein
MTRMIRSIAIGTLLGISCVACSTGEVEPKGSTSPVPRKTSQLNQLPEISLKGNPLPDQDTSVPPVKQRPIGEVQNGSDRIVAYTEGRKCGVLVIHSGNLRHPSVQLLTGWPKDNGAGTSQVPLGPYARSSALSADGSGAWVSAYCSKNAMIIDYSSDKKASPKHPRGSLSVSASPNKDNFTSVIAGTKDARRKIILALSSHSGSTGTP